MPKTISRVVATDARRWNLRTFGRNPPPYVGSYRCCVLLLVLLFALPLHAAQLKINFLPRFNGSPLIFDALTKRIAGAATISVTRLDFLLSNVALRRADGTWIGQGNWFGFVNARDGKTTVALSGIPAATYDRIRFQIGLDPAVNHADAAQWPAGHALNPDVNGLYWGWSREYVFLALEGQWRNDGAPAIDVRGYSYHLATDRARMIVELPAELALDSDCELEIAVDVAGMFSTPH